MSSGNVDVLNLVRRVNDTHNPITITSDKVSAVLVAEDDWKNIMETLYISSIPGMKESLIEGQNESLEALVDELVW